MHSPLAPAAAALVLALAGCAPATSPDQAVAMPFGQCLERIDATADRIGQAPAVLVETSEQRMVRFIDGAETVTVTCDALMSQMVVKTRPAPATF
ncbi:hypothetical protein [Limimaricola pyoseonensis]|uniref:Peptidase inhibitor I78 family protein n=1 Tax=Limimaricola pyoseonensis TaxID=521013 RepID=A0A1G7EC44_9RHOB|nr:hypothetical protein [Limimaricola pyoseonensis]SDE61284.1 hypothetical protein SAMN04488567_2101 [Limimaricola pyoseonensis]